MDGLDNGYGILGVCVVLERIVIPIAKAGSCRIMFITSGFLGEGGVIRVVPPQKI